MEVCPELNHFIKTLKLPDKPTSMLLTSMVGLKKIRNNSPQTLGPVALDVTVVKDSNNLDRVQDRNVSSTVSTELNEVKKNEHKKESKSLSNGP